MGSSHPVRAAVADGIRFDNESLNQMVKQCGIASPAQQTCEVIYETLVDFQQGTPQFNDVTLLT